MIKVLGFDISSTCIGWGLIEIDDVNMKLLDSGYIKPIKSGSIIDRLFDTRNKIKDLITKLSPTHIGIEDVICFMKGKSSANTVITLAIFNRMIALLSYDMLNSPPQLFSVMSIRHGLKLNKILPKKEDMPGVVEKHLGITFQYEKNRKNKNKPENYDRADGIAVALYYSFILTKRIKRKK